MKAHITPARRIRWHVLPLPGVVGWAVIRDDTEMCRFFFKFRAVSYAAHECQYETSTAGAASC